MNKTHLMAGMAIILSTTALGACSGGGGNATAGAGAGGDTAAPAALTSAQLVGSRWRLDNDACPNHRTLEFQADAIVTSSGTIRVTYRQDTAPTVLLATPEGGAAGSRFRFSLSGERLTMFNPENGLPCTFVRA